MAYRSEPKTKAFGAPSRSDLRGKNERAKEKHQRALARFNIARLVATMDGSLRAKRAFIRKAMDTTLIPQGPVPAVETIRTLEARWHAGAQKVEDYYDSYSRGREPTPLATAIEEEIHRAIYGGRAINAYALTRVLQTIAKRNGVEAPTYRQVHRRFAKAGRLVRAATRHGSRAGEIDGLPHARIMSRAPHDTWALDELTLPIWVAIYDWILNRWVSARCDVVLIIDVCSGAIVGYWICDPSTRTDELGSPMRSGFDADDVLAALLSAAVPELASDGTRTFSGHLPNRLRLDNAKAHKTVQRWAEDAAVEIDFRPIRKRRAASNSAVERRVGIVKRYCAGIRGHVDDHLPTDQVETPSDVDLALQRTKKAAYTNERLSRLVPILPEDLHTVAEIRVLFDDVVRRYNHEFANRVHGMTPAAKYKRDWSRRPRRGMDLVRAIAPCTVKVAADGILHTRNRVTQQFYPIIEGVLLLLDTAVTYHPDPVGRGIFVEYGDRLVHLRPQETLSDNDAAEVARNQSSIARTLSDGAARIREQEMIKAVGLEGLDAALDDYERRVAAIKEKEKQKKMKSAETIATGEDAPDITLAEKLAYNPWLAADPMALIRHADDDNTDEE